MCKPGVQGQKCTVCVGLNKILGPSGCVSGYKLIIYTDKHRKYQKNLYMTHFRESKPGFIYLQSELYVIRHAISY